MGSQSPVEYELISAITKSLFIISQLATKVNDNNGLCLFVCFGLLRSSLRKRPLGFYGPVCTKGHVAHTQHHGNFSV